MEKKYNVPNIVRIIDSLGNEYAVKEGTSNEIIEIIDPHTKTMKEFYFGDKITFWLTIDPSFQENDYTLEWINKKGILPSENGRRLDVNIGEELVADVDYITCKVISSKEWHKYTHFDQRITLKYRALPPE